MVASVFDSSNQSIPLNSSYSFPFSSIVEFPASPGVLIGLLAPSLLPVVSNDWGKTWVAKKPIPNLGRTAKNTLPSSIVAAANPTNNAAVFAWMDNMSYIYTTNTVDGKTWTYPEMIGFNPITRYSDMDLVFNSMGTGVCVLSAAASGGDTDLASAMHQVSSANWNINNVLSYSASDSGDDKNIKLAAGGTGSGTQYLVVGVYESVSGQSGMGSVGNDGDIMAVISGNAGSTWNSNISFVNSWAKSDSASDRDPSICTNGSRFLATWTSNYSPTGSTSLN